MCAFSISFSIILSLNELGNGLTTSSCPIVPSCNEIEKLLFNCKMPFKRDSRNVNYLFWFHKNIRKGSIENSVTCE